MSSTDSFIGIEILKVACPICGRKDYCMALPDMSKVICKRPVCKHLPSHGYKPVDTKSYIEGQRYVRDGKVAQCDRRIITTSLPARKPELDFTDYAKAAYKNTDRTNIAKQLGVTVESCDLLRIGYTQYYLKEKQSEQPAHSFPMRNDNGKIIGIRLRFIGGPKRAVKGSRAGLIFPYTMKPNKDRLLIAEGESDVLAALSMGFTEVIGKPGRLAGNPYIIEYLKKCYRDVVLVSDNDKDGYEGALRTAGLIIKLCRSVKIVIPPAKDLREWYNSGKGTKDRLLNIINSTKEYKNKDL